MNIYQKLIEVRKEVPYLQKENAGAQYKYVSSSQVLANCKAKMDELGLLLIPSVTGHKVTESIIEKPDREGNIEKRTTTYFTELDMRMMWVNAEKPEETIECLWYGQGVDIAGEKGVGKALTYSEKYFMLKFFNIPTDKDDPDSFQNKMNDEPKHKREPKKETPPPPSWGGNKPPQAPPSGGNKTITEAQQKRLFAICTHHNVPTDEVKNKILSFGFASSRDLDKATYDLVCEWAENYDNPDNFTMPEEEVF